MVSVQVQEARLRRAADRQGLRLMKTRRSEASDFGGYTLINKAASLVAGAAPCVFAFDIAGVEAYLR